MTTFQILFAIGVLGLVGGLVIQYRRKGRLIDPLPENLLLVEQSENSLLIRKTAKATAFARWMFGFFMFVLCLCPMLVLGAVILTRNLLGLTIILGVAGIALFGPLLLRLRQVICDVHVFDRMKAEFRRSKTVLCSIGQVEKVIIRRTQKRHGSAEYALLVAWADNEEKIVDSFESSTEIQAVAEKIAVFTGAKVAFTSRIG